jgi:succinate dehydrogenase / fumarate reductase cytochrome b subunit
VKQTRPVNLDLSSLKYPPMAIVSILHRMSGVILFLLFPWILYLLHLSLRSEATFQAMQIAIMGIGYKVLLWVFSAALLFHVLAGIRHITMDLGFAEGLCTARSTAIVVMVLAVISTIFLGIWIW